MFTRLGYRTELSPGCWRLDHMTLFVLISSDTYVFYPDMRVTFS